MEADELIQAAAERKEVGAHHIYLEGITKGALESREEISAVVQESAKRDFRALAPASPRVGLQCRHERAALNSKVRGALSKLPDQNASINLPLAEERRVRLRRAHVIATRQGQRPVPRCCPHSLSDEFAINRCNPGPAIRSPNSVSDPVPGLCPQTSRVISQLHLPSEGASSAPLSHSSECNAKPFHDEFLPPSTLISLLRRRSLSWWIGAAPSSTHYYYQQLFLTHRQSQWVTD